MLRIRRSLARVLIVLGLLATMIFGGGDIFGVSVNRVTTVSACGDPDYGGSADCDFPFLDTGGGGGGGGGDAVGQFP